MRLWTLHPGYLDTKGLVALWREALLAQAVLTGQTLGYTKHPQLIRFRETSSPAASIAAYLQEVQREASRRGYVFDKSKIGSQEGAETMEATSGQLAFEWEHLKAKLRVRAPSLLVNLQAIAHPDPHPLFLIVPGPVADWERTKA
ncbi:pyrimidine dimer DNA glycosylase/endonuclease V [Geotalea sp. SG265]|uniref:pyrimidine dimer DNA glycosylase/endonuclease V n=1 Tax=Geotalea sp. SG265 TaxID=2922867 RepID=UPI001FAF6647|nr:pyrimidine dimer DNA glycosylase/endonuclease V [Geotalea sp. SG265]